MKRCFLLLLISGSALLVASEETQPTKRATEENYSVELPEGWQTGRNESGLFYAVSPPSGPSDLFSENFTVYVEQVPLNATLAEYYTDATKGLKEIFPQVKIVSEGDASIDDHSAKWIQYTIPVGGRTFVFLQFCILKDEHAYILTAAADEEVFDEYRPIFQEIIKSFRFSRPSTE